MNKLLPIVPGCLVVILDAVDPRLVGLEATALKFFNKGAITRPHYRAGDDGWDIRLKDGGEGFFATISLMRIDGYEEDKDITEIAKELIHD